MTATKTAKYLPRMREVLLDYAADMKRGTSNYHSTATGTVVALLDRGALVHLTHSRKGLTRAGAEAVGADYDALVDAVHAYALEMNEQFRRCPFADEGCDFTSFGSPATPFGHYGNVTSDDQITYHVNAAHIPMQDAIFMMHIGHLTDEVREHVRQWLADHHPVTPAGPDTRIADVEQARAEALREYMQRHPGGPIAIMDSLHLAKLEGRADEWDGNPDSLPNPDGTNTLPVPMPASRPQYVVDLPVDTRACANDDVHHAHVWSHFGPNPVWYCPGVEPQPTTLEQDVAHEVARDEVGMREHDHRAVSETPSVFPGAPPVRTYVDGCQAYGPYPSAHSWSPA